MTGQDQSFGVTSAETGAAVEPAGEDAVLPYSVDALDVRGRVVYLGSALDAILRRHAYPEPVSRLLGEAIVLTALLGSSLKFKGRLILQTQTDGPVSMLVVDFQAPGNIRAYARFDEERLEAAVQNDAADTPGLLGKGHLAMTIDQGTYMQRYQGLVVLDGGSFEDVAHRYFEQSEQIPTRVRLAVGEMLTRHEGQEPDQVWKAGGIVAQFLPENTERMRMKDFDPGDVPDGIVYQEHAEDDAWIEAKALVDTVEDVELTAPEMNAERLLFRLFHERDPRVFPPQQVADKCRCTRDSVSQMLENFQVEERMEMVVDNQIEVTCEFCSAQYQFDPKDFDT
ncbi:MAG: Hsp33 family molecular chaperone [Stappiaceae bacterium]